MVMIVLEHVSMVGPKVILFGRAMITMNETIAYGLK
jgi:hypothetical protein